MDQIENKFLPLNINNSITIELFMFRGRIYFQGILIFFVNIDIYKTTSGGLNGWGVLVAIPTVLSLSKEAGSSLVLSSYLIFL